MHHSMPYASARLIQDDFLQTPRGPPRNILKEVRSKSSNMQCNSDLIIVKKELLPIVAFTPLAITLIKMLQRTKPTIKPILLVDMILRSKYKCVSRDG